MEAVSRLIFRTKKPEELVREWRQQIRAQERQLDRQLRSIETEELKAKRAVKQAASKKDNVSCRILARELVRSRRQKNRIHTHKAQLNSIGMQLQHQLAVVKMSGTLKQSTEVMKAVNQLVRVPALARQMQEMSMEMMKAGVIGEMMEETLDMMEDDTLEDEADEEVDKILFEITDGKLGELAAVPTTSTLPVAGQVASVGEGTEVEEEVEDEEDLEAMQARLQALRG